MLKEFRSSRGVATAISRRQERRRRGAHGPNSPWVIAGDPTVHLEGLIKFETDHFSEFALFARGAYQVHLPMVVGK